MSLESSLSKFVRLSLKAGVRDSSPLDSVLAFIAKLLTYFFAFLFLFWVFEISGATRILLIMEPLLFWLNCSKLNYCRNSLSFSISSSCGSRISTYSMLILVLFSFLSMLTLVLIFLLNFFCLISQLNYPNSCCSTASLGIFPSIKNSVTNLLRYWFYILPTSLLTFVLGTLIPCDWEAASSKCIFYMSCLNF